MNDKFSRLIFAGILLLAACCAHSQTIVRWDLGSPGGTGAASTQGAGLPYYVAIPGISIAWCSYPANAVPCTNYATTYTSISGTTPCATSTQIVLQGSSTCVATGDNVGDIGLYTAGATYLNPNGIYAYTLTYGGQSFGPFTVTVGGGAFPAGPRWSVQFNNPLGSFDGTANLVTDLAGDLTMAGTLLVGGSISATGSINSNAGYLFNSAAPLNHVLLGDGSHYIDSATIPYAIISGAPSLYYQTIDLNGSAQTQRPAFNFSALFTASDSASPARTNIGLVTTGSEAKLVTAVGSGANGDCAQWIATGGVGDAGFACATPAPLYTTTGTLVTDFHYVYGNCTTDGGSCTATFSGAAAFTSNASYQCIATKVGASSGITYVTQTSGTSVTFSAGGGQQILFYCFGD